MNTIEITANNHVVVGNRPASGVPGRAQFEADFLRALAEQA